MDYRGLRGVGGMEVDGNSTVWVKNHSFAGGYNFLFDFVSMIYHERFKGPQDTLKAIFEYIEIYYNRKRKHSTLGYKTPAQFEQAMKSAVCF